MKLSSIRDNFRVTDITFGKDDVVFTASGVAVPSIDYKLMFTVTKARKTSVGGSHDGYLAFLVQVNGVNLYEHRYKEKDLCALFGLVNLSVETTRSIDRRQPKLSAADRSENST